MRKDTIKKIAALCAALAMMMAAGCGYIEDLPADEGSGAGSSLAETVDNAEESAADEADIDKDKDKPKADAAKDEKDKT